MTGRLQKLGVFFALFSVAIGPSLWLSEAEAASFYEGKTLRLIVAYPAGGTQDIEARAIARFLPKHIPGSPRILILNMPGAGGLQAVKYAHTAVKPDGLTLGFFGASPPTTQLMADYLPKGKTMLDIDLRQFNWIGSSGGRAYIFIVRSDTPYKTLADLLKASKPIKAGATRPGSTTFIGPALLKATLGAPIDIITGYRGGSDRDLAFFRGETQSQYGSWASIVQRNRDWLTDKLARPMIMLGQRIPAKELRRWFGNTDVPHIDDLVKKPEDVALLRMAMAPGQWGRLIGAPPGTPSDRVQVLRAAMTSLAQDPEFEAGVAKRGLSLKPLNGEEVEKRIQAYMKTKSSTVKHFLKVVEGS
jgi:tripartite-type tricarboxylate transporter receptor subunit TctC